MTTERDSVAEMRALLREAGFKVIRSEAKIGDTSLRADVLAYASDDRGNLVPWLVVEAKSGVGARAESALPALIAARELLGTVEHYAVINGRWFRADRSLHTFEEVGRPAAPAFGGEGLLVDTELATSLLTEQLWAGSRSRVDYFFPTADNLRWDTALGVETAGGETVPVRDDVLWRARRQALAGYVLHSSRTGAEHTTSPVLAEAIAHLVGERLQGTVLDPFCGTGNFLWAAMDRALATQTPVEFVGQERDVALAGLAAEIGRTAPLMSTVNAGDSFHVDLPAADVVLAAPPFGVMAPAGWLLLDGTAARDLESAALDLCLRRLRPGGRAVLLLPVGITEKRALARYRDHLAHQFRIGAILGLPAGAVAGSNLRAVLIVIDRSEPADTFVAQFGDDWAAQLSTSGAAMVAALAHLDAAQAT